MNFQKRKILYYLIFVIYLTSIIVHPFFHHHQEGHDEGSDILHTHLINHSQGNEHTGQTEFHSDQNNYFDENHILISTGFLLTSSFINIPNQIIEVSEQEQNSSEVLIAQSDCKISREKYVLTEANLPPPLS